MLSNTIVMLSNSAFPDVCGAPPPVNPIPIPYPNLTPGSLPHANHIDGQAHAGNKKAITTQKNIIEKAQGKSSVTIKSATQANLLNTALKLMGLDSDYFNCR